MSDKKQIAIIGGGTIQWVCNHLALAAPAKGTTARRIDEIVRSETDSFDPVLYLTTDAGGCEWSERNFKLETNDDISRLVDILISDDLTKIVFFTASILDFEGHIYNDVAPGKYGTRLPSHLPQQMTLHPVRKIINKIRKKRKDIFLVGFKQTCGKTEDEQYIAGLNLCKKASCNLVLANDSDTRLNMIITPEEARYHVTKNREEVLQNLVEMTLLRSHLTFTRSTVIDGQSISWSSIEVPETLRTVVDWCVTQGAYKPFNGATVGHFACKLDEQTFLTSIRRSNFNDIHKNGLVKVKTDGPDSVMAYGAKPSVGGQSQRIVFHEHSDYDCIVHFHCPIKPGSEVPMASQREFECGSLECGKNTSTNLKKFGNLSAVYLDNHGPNIVFHHSIDPNEVINFIKENFDLERKTGGFVSVQNH